MCTKFKYIVGTQRCIKVNFSLKIYLNVDQQEVNENWKIKKLSAS